MTPFYLMLSSDLQPNRTVAHATRSPNRRQECRERGYYHLHRQLDDLLFLHTIFRFFSVVRGTASSEAGGARLLRRRIVCA